MALCISYMSWHAMGLVHALSPISIYFTIIWSHGCVRTSIVCIKSYFTSPTIFHFIRMLEFSLLKGVTVVILATFGEIEV